MKLHNININDTLIAEIAEQYNIIELYVFGSILRDDFKPVSDIDIMVKFAKTAKYSFFEFFDLKNRFEQLFKRKIDLVEIDGIKNPYRRSEILKTARQIYAS